MHNKQEFKAFIEEGNSPKGEALTMGAAMLDGETIKEAFVKIPLKTMNRHGLIAGATGTGKTKTLQVIAENLSDAGVPVLLMDMKGDLSGIAKPSPGHPKIDERHAAIGLPFTPKQFPVEVLSLSEQDGVRLRATISEFGPVLFARMLDATDAQEGVIAIVFKYCDDNGYPLLDLEDFKSTLRYITEDGKEAVESEYGRVSKASVGAILRKLIELEQQGAELFFGEKSFEVDDLLRTDRSGKGYISILRLTDIQDRPKLFSTFMLSLLAEIYSTFPEQGDSDRPKLALFIDEAHLIFDEASDALLDKLESIVKLIRSKGVGLYFITQNPTDIPEAVLSQLGLKVQHALRAFTAKDRKAVKLAAENYPDSPYYDTKTVLTELGIGEAMVSALDEKGRPTPLAAVMLRAPMTRMDILKEQELKAIIEESSLVKKYNKEIDRESASEMLTEKIARAAQEDAKEKARLERDKLNEEAPSTKRSSRRSKPQSSQLQKSLIKVLTSATVIRGVLGILTKMIK